MELVTKLDQTSIDTRFEQTVKIFSPYAVKLTHRVLLKLLHFNSLPRINHVCLFTAFFKC